VWLTLSSLECRPPSRPLLFRVRGLGSGPFCSLGHLPLRPVPLPRDDSTLRRTKRALTSCCLNCEHTR
jgi:hypothetical protein